MDLTIPRVLMWQFLVGMGLAAVLWGVFDKVVAAWIGEIGKLALTVLFFTLVFTLVKPLAAAALFAGFITTQLVIFSGFLMRQEQDTDNSNGS